MSDQFSYTYPSPLEGYEDLAPLPEYALSPGRQPQIETISNASSREKNEDGKSLKNPQHGILSKAYEAFPSPIDNGRRGGFDVHIYHYQVGTAAGDSLLLGVFIHLLTWTVADIRRPE